MKHSEEPQKPRRIIKRYSNRKLYDTVESRYVTLLEVAELTRAGEDVQVIDNATKADKTDVTFALIISEELKTQPRGIPMATLRSLIRARGERLLTQLREGPIGRLIPRESEVDETSLEGEPKLDDGPVMAEEPGSSGTVKTLKATLEQWQQVADERIRSALLSFSEVSTLREEVRRLADRVDRLEAERNPNRN